jgi:hypothetical protein
VPVEGGEQVDRAGLAQGAVLGDQVGEGSVLARCEHRRRGAVLEFDQGQAGDGLQVPGPGDPHGDGGRAAPRRCRLDAVGAAASEPEVRQRLGQALQRSRADIGTVEGGRQLRPHLPGSGLLASNQCTSALHSGPVQSLDNQHHHSQGAMSLRAGTIVDND